MQKIDFYDKKANENKTAYFVKKDSKYMYLQFPGNEKVFRYKHENIIIAEKKNYQDKSLHNNVNQMPKMPMPPKPPMPSHRVIQYNGYETTSNLQYYHRINELIMKILCMMERKEDIFKQVYILYSLYHIEDIMKLYNSFIEEMQEKNGIIVMALKELIEAAYYENTYKQSMYCNGDRKKYIDGLLEEIHTAQNDFKQKIIFYDRRKEEYVKKYNDEQKKQRDTFGGFDDKITAFAGCSDLQSLNHRYKMLMKEFHTDSKNGDHKMATKITAIYNQLKKIM